MKLLLNLLITITILFPSINSLADEKAKRVLTGVLIGGAVGSIASHSIHGLSDAEAITAFALAGAILSLDWNSDYCYKPISYYDYDYSHDYQCRYYRRTYDSYNYQPRRYYTHYYKKERKEKKLTPAELAKPANLHPGVDLIKIPVTHSNGATTEISILKLNDRFVGPQGEIYDTLPTAEILKSKYSMSLE